MLQKQMMFFDSIDENSYRHKWEPKPLSLHTVLPVNPPTEISTHQYLVFTDEKSQT